MILVLQLLGIAAALVFFLLYLNTALRRAQYGQSASSITIAGVISAIFLTAAAVQVVLYGWLA